MQWVSVNYESQSLPRVVSETFGEAFLHERGSSDWGWRHDYVNILARLMEEQGSSRVPLLDLMIWLYRKEPVTGDNLVAELIARFLDEFKLTGLEYSALFEPIGGNRQISLSPTPAKDAEILNQVGWPEGSSARNGYFLNRLQLSNVGPAGDITYAPSERMNVITGDNSLGKSFILECMWWALTGVWVDYEAEPNRVTRIGSSEIGYSLSDASGRDETFLALYDKINETWVRPGSSSEGLAFFATHGGAIATWDPLRAERLGGRRSQQYAAHNFLTRAEIWNGQVRRDDHGRIVYVSNGLIRDLATWQLSKDRYGDILKAFELSLREVSPPDGINLRPGPLVKIPRDSRDIPTVRMPYGDVPVVYASAGVRRIVALAYMLVWHIHQHLEFARAVGREPLRRMVILLDEVEAHLHPRWQRQIVPAILKMLNSLTREIEFQVHIATHSPIVMASVEPNFDLNRDRLHHLTFHGDAVHLEPYAFSRHGTIDAWLESEIFGFADARSLEGERIIEKARTLQVLEKIDINELHDVNEKLRRYLPEDDPFWARWNYFYLTKTGAMS